MKPRAISHVKVMPSRSLAWAAQLKQRYARFTEFYRLSMQLYVPALARTLLLLQQYRFRSLLNLHPRLSLSLNQQNILNAWRNNVNTPQMTLLKLFSLTNLPASSIHEDILRTRYLRDYDDHRQLALTLAINRTSSDVATTLTRKFQVQREGQVREIATLLTQRVRRISEPSAVQTPMAFRAQAANPVTAAEPSVEVRRSRDAFERQNGLPTMPSMAPPAVNVQLLADEVMKQIDRRVIARRERMGQI